MRVPNRPYKQCIESGCTRQEWARGWCGLHYERHRKNGTMPPRVLRTEEERLRDDLKRFALKVNTDGPTMPHMDTPCHVWTGFLERQSYGMFSFTSFGGKDTIKAHRWRYQASIGRRLLPDEYVLHRCDNPPCVRLDHLYLGDHELNTVDMTLRNRQAKGADNAAAKLSERDVLTILSRSGTESNASLAREFGVSKVTIGHIVNGKSWTHLPESPGYGVERERRRYEATRRIVME